MATPPPAEQFWLLTGEVPSGPFTVAQVHAELAAGRANWQTPACAVGGSTWLPLVQTPGIGPSALPLATADARPPTSPSSSVAVATTPSIDEPASESAHVATAVTPASACPTTPSPDTPPAESQNITAAAPQAAQPQADAGPLQTTSAPNDNRPSRTNGSNRFWLLVGTETIGPFRVADIRYKLQAGELSPDAKARRVGTEDWVSLTEAVGALPPRPTAVPKASPSGTAAAERPTSQPPAPSTHTSRSPDQNRADGWLGWIGAALTILLAYGLIQGAGWVYEQFRPQNKPTALVPSVKPNPVTTTPPTAPPAGGTTAPAGTHGNWALGGPPRMPPGLQDTTARLVGSWRWDGGGGYSSTYTFEADGAFTYYVTGANPLLNIPVSGCQAYGRWSVRDGTLFVEFTGASDPVLVPAFRGLTARSPVQFAGDSAVRLTGVEGDTATRTYARIR